MTLLSKSSCTTHSHYLFNFGSMNCTQTKAVSILEVTIHYSWSIILVIKRKSNFLGDIG